jgi:nucleotide-binding universal stress UspA family protein
LSFALPRISLRHNSEEHDSTGEQKFGSTFESSKTRHIPIGFPSFGRILVAYDGTQMSKRVLSYAAYISKVSDSEMVIVNIVKANRDLNNVLPVTIKANLEAKEEQIDMAGSQRGVLLDEPLREVVEEMTTACKAAGVTKKITYEIRGGHPANEIINVSNLMHFDLIVMGSRRIASRIEGIGSTTRKVVTTVKTPLLIVQKQRRYKDEW